MKAFYEDGGIRVYCGDVLECLRQLPAESVHCVVTSPPYWGLRDYGVEGQIGLEATPAEYLAKIVEVFREVRRVLRADGTCWVNMGDSYATGTSAVRTPTNTSSADVPSGWANRSQDIRRHPIGLKPKDLIGQPWMLAFALRADGWWLRQDIIWAKPNPMPESVTDRCTKAHEYLFLLTKSERYFYDADAIRIPFSSETKALSFETMDFAKRDRYAGGSRRDSFARLSKDSAGTNGQKPQHRVDRENVSYSSGANKRSVWWIATEPFPEAHFATFPTKLVEPCILAGTSEKGCCAACGAPWVRVTERVYTGRKQKMADGWDTGEGGHGTVHRDGREAGEAGEAGVSIMATTTTGWKPMCECDEIARPCTVLDPFSGSGTTGLVALANRCRYIGIELNAEYAAMSARRFTAALAQEVMAFA